MNELLKHPEADSIYAALTMQQRREVGVWCEICQRLLAAPNKGAEMARILAEYDGKIKGLSRSSAYRKLEAFRERGISGLAPMSAINRLVGEASSLPDEFVQFWQSLCGKHQRQKARAAYRALFLEYLVPGRIIPGYDCDWRGIWSREHPHLTVPAVCPYSPVGQHPEGWSYRNLLLHKPDKDVWAGAAYGAQAMRSLLPSIPHTRVGLEFGSLFVVDDVWHDHKVTFLGEKNAERPLELAMMECLTGRITSWGLTPVRRRDDDSRIMLKESYMRYLLVDMLCRVGVSPRGVTILAEHGTAAIRGGLLEQINAEIKRLTNIDGFVKVETSSVYGKPLVEGLFAERPRGNPRFKAMLESTWNLLHNELAMLPGQVGKDRDHSPADIAGRDKEMALLAPIANAIAKEMPTEAQHLITGYLNFFEFEKILLKVKSLIENRQDHHLEGWQECGFVHQIATIAGLDVDIDQHYLDHPESMDELNALIRMKHCPVRSLPMSPIQAWAKCEEQQQLVRFPMSLAGVILGEACGKKVKVSDKGTITIPDEFCSARKITYNATVTDGNGRVITLPRGAEVIVNLNPFDTNSSLLVTDKEGRWLGYNDKPYKAATLGDREADKVNLGLLAEAAAEQRQRLAPVIAGQLQERRNAVAQSTASLLGISKSATPKTLGDGSIASLEDITSKQELIDVSEYDDNDITSILGDISSH